MNKYQEALEDVKKAYRIILKERLIRKEVETYREIKSLQELVEFKKYFDELYGCGYEIANFHLNGELEPFDNFYDNAIDWSEENE